MYLWIVKPAISLVAKPKNNQNFQTSGTRIVIGTMVNT